MMSLELGLRFFLGLLFIGAGASKLRDHAAFEHAVLNYRLLPDRLAKMVAFWLPRLELASGLALLVGFLTQVVAAGLAVLIITFIVGIGINLLRGREIDCGCSGGRYRRITWTLVEKDAVLAGMAVFLALRGAPALGVDQTWTGSRGVSDLTAFAVLMSVTCVVGLYGLAESVRDFQTVARQFEEGR